MLGLGDGKTVMPRRETVIVVPEPNSDIRK